MLAGWGYVLAGWRYVLAGWGILDSSCCTEVVVCVLCVLCPHVVGDSLCVCVLLFLSSDLTTLGLNLNSPEYVEHSPMYTYTCTHTPHTLLHTTLTVYDII